MGGDNPKQASKKQQKGKVVLAYDPTSTMGVLPFFPQESLSNSSSSNSLISMDTPPTVTLQPSNLPSEQGASTMLKTSTPADQSSSSSSSSEVTAEALTAPSPSLPNAQQKSSIDTLKDLEKQLAYYVYLEKGLSTAEKKSYYTAGTRFLGNVTGLAPTVGVYDMFDADAQTNLDLYLQYMQALNATKSDDSGSRSELLAKIQDIFKNTSWKGNRFPTMMKSLLELYIKVLDPKASSDEAQKFVIAAQKMREPAKETPSQEASSDDIKNFIKNGPSTPLLAVIDKKIAEYSVDYSTDKAKTPNRMDARLNYGMIRLQEHIPQKSQSNGADLKSSKEASNIHLHEIMHYLHKSLDMFKEMHNVVGVPATHPEFLKTVETAQEHLESYRGRDHAQALDQVRKTCIELCEKLTILINKYKDKEHPFDPTLAKSYLQTVSNFASLEKTEQRLRGAAEMIVANSAKSAAAKDEKKMHKV